MTLLDNSINKDYTYLIGIEDYGWGGQGQTDFTRSGAKITITNGIRTEVIRMVADADSLTFPNEYANLFKVKIDLCSQVLLLWLLDCDRGWTVHNDQCS